MTHNEIIDLLPWFANQTLAESERRDVEVHLSNCASCRRELEQYQTIGLAVLESAEEAPESSPELLRRALAEIHSYEQQKAIAEIKPAAWITELLGRLGETLFGWIGPAPVLARAVVAAQFLIVIVLAGGLGVSVWKRSEYSTLSGSTAGRGDGTIISVRFNENITEAQLRQTLAEIKATIVAGPSALGLYAIEVPTKPSKTDEIEKLLQSLRSKSQIIAYAEKSG